MKRADQTDIVYSYSNKKPQHHRHIISILVENEFGILARITSLFSARGYNIDTLTVAEVDAEKKVSRITVATYGDDKIILQIISQLERLVPVHSVHDLAMECKFVERELALVKVRSTGDARVEALRIADIFEARVVDTTIESFVFEVFGKSEKIDTFIELMRPLGLINNVRTGVVAIARGATNLPNSKQIHSEEI